MPRYLCVVQPRSERPLEVTQLCALNFDRYNYEKSIKLVSCQEVTTASWSYLS